MDERLNFILGAGILIISYYIGEMLSYVIVGLISPAVMGMLVLFTLLKTGIVKAIWIESFAVFLLDNLMLFFIPATAGVALISFSSIKDDALAIVFSASLSSLLVLWIVGYIVQKFERANGK
ncbi:MAG: CidA/LrgA family protein [Bacteroidales bacterium]|jgi:holin-like protein